MAQFFPDLIPYRIGNLWGYVNRKKDIIIDIKYDQAYPFIGNIARVIKNGYSGIINREGEEVISVMHEEVGSFITGSLLNENGTCSIYHQEKYGLVSIYGEILADVVFDSEFEAMNHAESNGWTGAIPFDRYPHIPIEKCKNIDAIKSFVNGIAPFKQNGLWGLIDKNGKIVSEALFEEIDLPDNGFWPFRIGTLWGILDSNGNIVIKEKFDMTRGFSNGLAGCQLNGRWGIIDMTGQWKISPQYEEIGEYKDGLIAVQKNGLFGFVDQDGHKKIEFQYQDVMDFHEGIALVFDHDDIYPINLNGEIKGDKYKRIFGPNSQGLIHIMKGDQWGIIKPNGKLLLPISYDLPKTMEQVIQTIEEDRVPIKKGPYLGYADLEGNTIAAPKYVTIDAYCESLSLVSIPHETLGPDPKEMEMAGYIAGVFKFGFIDLNGTEIIPPKYNLARRFEGGLAFVTTEIGTSGYITYDGEEYFEDHWD